MARLEELEAWDKELNDLFGKLIGGTVGAPSFYGELPGAREILMSEPHTRQHVDAIIEIIKNYVPPEPLEKLEAFSRGGDSAKWSLDDFYEEPEKALKAAIEKGTPFTTGWFAVKKEPQSGKITRFATNGPISISASVSMDDGPDLIDTIIWEASHKSAGSGEAFLSKVMKKKAVEDAMNSLLDGLTNRNLIFDENTESESAEILGSFGFDEVALGLRNLAAGLERRLEDRYQAAIVFTRAWLTQFPKAKKLLKGLDREHGILDWEPD